MADVLVLNYALGFSETSLDFLDSRWQISRLDVLAREITDLTPIGRLNRSLRKLSIQASSGATLDLSEFGRLESVGAEWAVIGESIRHAHSLTEVLTFRYPDANLRGFKDLFTLQALTVKQAPFARTLEGVETLPALESLGVYGAKRLTNIADLRGMDAVRDLQFEDAPAISDVAIVNSLYRLRCLGVSNCGGLESLSPLRSCVDLEVLYAWGSTLVEDGDLSPLETLPVLREVRMRDRPMYNPRVRSLRLGGSPKSGT